MYHDAQGREIEDLEGDNMRAIAQEDVQELQPAKRFPEAFLTATETPIGGPKSYFITIVDNNAFIRLQIKWNAADSSVTADVCVPNEYDYPDYDQDEDEEEQWKYEHGYYDAEDAYYPGEDDGEEDEDDEGEVIEIEDQLI